MLDRQYLISISSGTIVRAILFGLLVAGIYVFWDLVLVVLMAIVLASAIEPAARWAVRRKIPRLLAVVLIYLFTAASFMAILYAFIPPVLEEAAGLLSTLPHELDLADLLGPVGENGPEFLRPGITTITENLSLAEVVSSLRGTVLNLSSNILKVLSTVFGGIVSFVLIVVLSFYLAVQEGGIEAFIRIVTPVRHERYITDLWHRSQFKIGKWLQGQLVLMLIVGVLVYLGLVVLGVRYALLLALLAALFEIIPLFGPVLAAIPAIGIALVDGGLTQGLLVAGLYTIIQQFENQLIHPLVVSKVVGVPPLLVILALLIGARLAGFLGLILSVPVAAAFREYLHDLERGRIEKQRAASSTG
jgi:predicted PurR-regulated permease PerM